MDSRLVRIDSRFENSNISQCVCSLAALQPCSLTIQKKKNASYSVHIRITLRTKSANIPIASKMNGKKKNIRLPINIYAKDPASAHCTYQQYVVTISISNPIPRNSQPLRALNPTDANFTTAQTNHTGANTIRNNIFMPLPPLPICLQPPLRYLQK